MKRHCFALTIFIRLNFLTKKKLTALLKRLFLNKFCQSHGSTEKGQSHENKT